MSVRHESQFVISSGNESAIISKTGGNVQICVPVDAEIRVNDGPPVRYSEGSTVAFSPASTPGEIVAYIKACDFEETGSR